MGGDAHGSFFIFVFFFCSFTTYILSLRQGSYSESLIMTDG